MSVSGVYSHPLVQHVLHQQQQLKDPLWPLPACSRHTASAAHSKAWRGPVRRMCGANGLLTSGYCGEACSHHWDMHVPTTRIRLQSSSHGRTLMDMTS